jgi:GntR family transcriptional regulator, rspAB operon transcriptional repressor
MFRLRGFHRSATNPFRVQISMTAKFEPLEYVHLTDLTTAAIRRQILRRELATGSQIPVDTVAAQLGVSRTPVIEALKQLENEGLVEVVPRRGCFVRKLVTEDVREIFEAREAIELFCTCDAIRQGRHKALAKSLTPLIDKMNRQTHDDRYIDIEAFIAADREFHNAIVASGGNQRLKTMYDRLNIHMHVLRVYYFRSLEPPTRVAKDHLSIQRSLSAGNVAAAEGATRRHLARMKAKMIANLELNGGGI